MCNSCASLAGLVLSLIACFILLVIAPYVRRSGNENERTVNKRLQAANTKWLEPEASQRMKYANPTGDIGQSQWGQRGTCCWAVAVRQASSSS